MTVEARLRLSNIGAFLLMGASFVVVASVLALAAFRLKPSTLKSRLMVR